MKRALALALVACLGAVFGMPSVASAAWHYDSPTRVMSGWTDSAQPGQAFPTGEQVDLPLGTRLDDAGVAHTSRIYATFDLSKYEGKKVTGGTVYVQESSAADCTKRSIELWRTRAVTAAPTWKRAPAALSKLAEEQASEYCPRGTIGFDVSVAIAEARAAKQRLVTFELRVPAEHEADPGYGRTLNWYRDVSLSLAYNTVPKMDNANLYTGGQACTQLKPYPVRNLWGGTLQALVTDPDSNEQLTAEFAVWPVGSPADRTVHVREHAQSGSVATVNVPQAQLVHDTAYGWQARITDGTETSPWSKKCFVKYDGVAPSVPAVTSTNYPQDDWGPLGEHPTFVFDGHGDKDIAGFQYSWYSLGGTGLCASDGQYGQLVCKDPLELEQTVKADVPGGKTTVTLNPDRVGTAELTVRSIDLAGNTSPSTSHRLLVRDSGPLVTEESGPPEWNQEVLLKIAPAAGLTGVTEYQIQRPGSSEPETLRADENGVAYLALVASDPNGGSVAIRSVGDGGFVSAPANWSYNFLPWPGVRSEVYDNTVGGARGGVGVEGSFTFSPPPGWSEVAEYQYRIDGDWDDPHVVPAGADGRATITWTPQTPGQHYFVVHAVKPDGTTSEYSNYYPFDVAE